MAKSGTSAWPTARNTAPRSMGRQITRAGRRCSWVDARYANGELRSKKSSTECMFHQVHTVEPPGELAVHDEARRAEDPEGDRLVGGDAEGLLVEGDVPGDRAHDGLVLD